MYDIADIAKDIVSECYLKGHPITNTELQCYLFFCDCVYLEYKNDLLFPDLIKPRERLPMYEPQYYMFGGHGAMDICNFYDHKEIDKEAMRIIDYVISCLSKLSLAKLVQKTYEGMEKETRWKKIKGRVLTG